MAFYHWKAKFDGEDEATVRDKLAKGLYSPRRATEVERWLNEAATSTPKHTAKKFPKPLPEAVEEPKEDAPAKERAAKAEEPARGVPKIKSKA
jgi:hypothetical protein